MSSHVKIKKERVGAVDYEVQIKGNMTYHSNNFISFCHIPSLLQFKSSFVKIPVPPRKSRFCVCVYVSSLSEVRSQLIDQLKVLDLQLEVKTQQLQDITDYLRRRGEIENEYARSLEKLAERFTSRTKR